MSYPPPKPPAHYAPMHGSYDKSHWGTASLSKPSDESGESFVQDGRRYYWFIRDGRRFYTSHPQPGMVPANGPSGTGAPTMGGISDLDSPLSPTEQAQQHALREKALQRLSETEQRIAKFTRHSQRKIHQRAAKLRKKPHNSLR